jgi:phospholipid transport system substrate-binding protein
MRKVILALLLCAPVLVSRADEAAEVDSGVEIVQAEETPRVAIDRLNKALLEIMMRADELGYSGRYALVAPVVLQTFDMNFMASKSIGSTWRKLQPDERARWVETFGAYTISSMADRFDGFSGETLKIVGDRPASHETLVIQTSLDRPGEDSVGLDYRMRAAGPTWKIIDVYSDGKVSEIALRRSEYASVLRSGGIEGLITAVSEKTQARAGD